MRHLPGRHRAERDGHHQGLRAPLLRPLHRQVVLPPAALPPVQEALHAPLHLSVPGWNPARLPIGGEPRPAAAGKVARGQASRRTRLHARVWVLSGLAGSDSWCFPPLPAPAIPLRRPLLSASGCCSVAAHVASARPHLRTADDAGATEDLFDEEGWDESYYEEDEEMGGGVGPSSSSAAAAAANRPRLVISNRRYGSGGFLRSGRSFARPIQQPVPAPRARSKKGPKAAAAAGFAGPSTTPALDMPLVGGKVRCSLPGPRARQGTRPGGPDPMPLPSPTPALQVTRGMQGSSPSVSAGLLGSSPSGSGRRARRSEKRRLADQVDTPPAAAAALEPSS